MSEILNARVIRSTGSWYTVMDTNGNEYECRLKGLFRNKGIRTTNPIAVGDKVDLSVIDNDSIITNIHPRNNYIIRKSTKLSKSSHIIAANIDQVVIIVSLAQPRTSTGFIDRLLVTAEAYHIPATIVFNKIDIYEEDNLNYLKHLEMVYFKLGYNVILTSAMSGEGLDLFSSCLQDKISLVSGHSGVGKSALINKVDSSLNLKTGSISEYHNKGTHTTTFAQMYKLNFGGYVIDTPGIKEFGLFDFNKWDLGQRFPEIRTLMHDCKFHNCTHVNEPGCVVVNALEDKTIEEFRYNNYINILNSI